MTASSMKRSETKRDSVGGMSPSVQVTTSLGTTKKVPVIARIGVSASLSSLLNGSSGLRDTGFHSARLCYQCPLTAQHIENGKKMVLGPPNRYGIKMVKKWYGQSQSGPPKDGRYGLEILKKWSETTLLLFPDHICHLWGDPSGSAHTIFSPFSYHTFLGGPKTIFGPFPLCGGCKGTLVT